MATAIQSWADILNELVVNEILPDRVHRVLLYGPPGTGKSSWAQTRVCAC